MSVTDFRVSGTNQGADFTLKLHRGEGMVLLGMNWKDDRQPPRDFVGFGIEYREPGAPAYTPVSNRLAFPTGAGQVNPQTLSSLQSPIQKFRWVHFPPQADVNDALEYRVTPVYMNPDRTLRTGPVQEATIGLGQECYPDELKVAFTRGFVSSQAFVDRYENNGHTVDEIVPPPTVDGLTFQPTHPQARQALEWMGFEARRAILDVLDQAIRRPDATVRVVAYDLNEPEVVDRLEKLGKRLKVIIDDNPRDHGLPGSSESEAAERLRASAGEANVVRQRMLNIQHNKTIVVEGGDYKAAVCGSTNFSWRGFFVQSNNALVFRTQEAVDVFAKAFDIYFASASGKDFQKSPATAWTQLQCPHVKGLVTFSPHETGGGVLDAVARDVDTARSSVLFSLAFLYQTRGAMRDAIQRLEQDPHVFVYGMSDRAVGGLDMKNADGHFALSQPGYLHGNVPEPFRSEPSEAAGIRLHHKFLVVDFDQPTARVYTGSFNFSGPADLENGENLLVIKDQRVATAYMVEAVRLFDHYEYRARQSKESKHTGPLELALPPKTPRDKPWWAPYWSDPGRIRDRKLFS